jgi:glycosyltransferase involved in cell wall biosynthesis
MEAMVAGVPAVVTDIPGNRDLVQHGISGYLYPVGDRAALARLTKMLLEDPELAHRLGQAGQQRMRTEFSIQRMVARHHQLYERLMHP